MARSLRRPLAGVSPVSAATDVRPPVAFIAWSSVSGRSAEIAAALGGEARCFYDLGIRFRPLIPVRYAISAVRTVSYLLRRRPHAVIATNPPVWPGILALAYGRAAGAQVLLDSHPGSFGLKGDRYSALLLPVHRWLCRHVAATLVTVDQLADCVRGWGGRAELLHEAPTARAGAETTQKTARPRALFVCTFDPDEAVEEVLEAAADLNDIEMRVTGDLRRCPPDLRSTAPANVTFTGFLRGDAYQSEIASADVVLALTTEPTSVVRAGYEAVYAERPLVVTGWPNLRHLFPYAVYVTNDAPSIARGIRRALNEQDALTASAPRAREVQEQRWLDQLAVLRKLVAPAADEVLA
jgi:hypothetical protein